MISFVIVTWNAREALLRCLDSVRLHPPSQPWEVIVIDNASRDGSVAAVRAAHSDVRVIANHTNIGLAAANNQGMAAAAGDYVALSNPDVLYLPGTVDAMFDLAVRRPRAAFVIPRLLHPDGRLQTSAGSLPSLYEALFGRRISHRHVASRDKIGGFWWDGWAHDEERRIGHGAESCYLVRAAAVREFGAQDDGFFLDWEGIDWSARASAAGWEIWLCPAAEVVHVGGVSVKQLGPRWIVATHRGMYRYFSGRIPMVARPFLAGLIAARALVKVIAQGLGSQLYDRANRGFDVGIP